MSFHDCLPYGAEDWSLRCVCLRRTTMQFKCALSVSRTILQVIISLFHDYKSVNLCMQCQWQPDKPVSLHAGLQTFDPHLGALILSLNEDYLGRNTHQAHVLEDRASATASDKANALLCSLITLKFQHREHAVTSALQSCVCLHLSLSASVLQLSHDDCDGGFASQREDLYLQEAHSLPELDRSAHEKSVFNLKIYGRG